MKFKYLVIILLFFCGVFVWAVESGQISSVSKNIDKSSPQILPNGNISENLQPTATEIAMSEETSEEIIRQAPESNPSEERSLANSGKSISCEMEPEMNPDVLSREILNIFSDFLPLFANSDASQNNSDSKEEIIAGIVGQGDTVGKILGEAADGRVQHYINAMNKVFSPGSFRAGQPYTVITDPESGKVKRFEYEINSLRRLVVEGEEEPRARVEDIHYTTILEACAGVIDDNLFQAVADAGESPQLAVRLAELFGSEINFAKDLQQGDSFVVLHEKKYRNGHYRGYGRLLAARFTNREKTYEAFLFHDKKGRTHYYNSRGENLKKTLLQAPLAITRVTSKFTHSRKHPILGKSRPHLGVDYGAPTGTPVKAVGDGIVTKRGWAGGYGNQIIIRHSSGLESLYAHLSRYASGLHAGQKVRQGQVIGYVGSTGLSTGPHLDFRLRQNGAFINPAKAINPRGEPVSPGLMQAFTKIMAQERAYLDGHRLPRHYAIDSIVPLNVASSQDEISTTNRTKKRKANPRIRKNSRSNSKKRS